jgi:NADH-quinone oxidoreductase subunit A
MSPWSAAAVFLALAAAISSSMLLAQAILGVRAKLRPPTTFDTYECGEEAEGSAWIRFHPRYYLVALVFVVFDVEAAFLLPWALNLRHASPWTLVEMAAFLGVLLLGWLYAVRKGALKWP